jgi:hypothetical protein
LKFDKHATVHPATVTEYSEGGHRRGRRAELGKRRPYSTTAETIQVHPEVWKIALARCAGDPRRIEVISATEVEIHNDPDWRSQR